MNTDDKHTPPDSVDFFISYTEDDVEWARWIAWELEREGYTYRLQAEHFPPGARFMNEMRVWLQKADHVLPILSEAYFGSPFASLEMNSAAAEDPLGEARRVIPVRIENCTIPTLFRDLVYIDFVGSTELEQRRRLIAGIRAAKVGSELQREIRKRPSWPGIREQRQQTVEIVDDVYNDIDDSGLRVQFIACDVGRGLDLKGQYEKIKAVIEASRFSDKIVLQAEFDVNDVNLFAKLNSYRPHVIHISGNQNGGDVLLPSPDGGEVVVPDEALAGLLSSLGARLRLAIIDTCKSYHCAKRISEAVECAVGVEDDIFDNEATRFYEVFYQAISAGQSIADAYGQASAALQFKNVPEQRIPQLCVNPAADASELFMVGNRSEKI